MVITEMVSSADNIARGFLPGGGLAAGLVAISSKKSLKPKDRSLRSFRSLKYSYGIVFRSLEFSSSESFSALKLSNRVRV